MRLLVSRPEPGASRTAARLAALGHAALVDPMLRIEPVAAAAPHGPFDAIAFTSLNAVTAYAGPPGDAPVFAVGPRTADAARQRGWQNVSECGGDAADLARRLARALPPGARILHPAGEARAADLAALVASHGLSVETLVVYRAHPADRLAPGTAAALEAGTLDGALHFSPRTARSLLACVEAERLLQPFRRLRHFCLSPAIGAVLSGAGIPADVAAAPSEDALIALLPVGGPGQREVAP